MTRPEQLRAAAKQLRMNAGWHPLTAAVADWLDDDAHRLEMQLGFGVHDDLDYRDHEAAMKVARVVLGGMDV